MNKSPVFANDLNKQQLEPMASIMTSMHMHVNHAEDRSNLQIKTHDICGDIVCKDISAEASVSPCDDREGEQKITIDTENFPICNAVQEVQVVEGEMVVGKEEEEEGRVGYTTMNYPHYWGCVEEYQPLFDRFGAIRMPLKATALDLIKTVLRSNPGEEPFYVMDLSRLVRQYMQWKQLLPRVHPFYAVKCNDSPIIVQVLGALGASFDCASKQEIDTVLTHAGKLATGSDQIVDPASRIIFANPCKQISHCRHAANVGVEMTTVDNEFELKKLKKHWPEALVVIRIKTDDSMSVCQFSTKFGANVTNGEVERLVQLCQELDLKLHGVSFHVGSGCQSVYSFVDALVNVRKVFDIAKGYGYDLKFVDIGGGFPGVDGGNIDFIDIANTIRPVMDDLFEEDVQIIGEPGRYFACASYALVCNVFAKRDSKTSRGQFASDNNALVSTGKPQPQPEVLYYINDGLYGSFNCIYFDHAEINLQYLPADNINEPTAPVTDSLPTRPSTVFGPTCDSMDKVIDCKPLPEMDIGDYVFVEDFGAYTCASSSAFNGFKTDTFHFFWRN